jgi:ATP-dependent helicase/nuclease subunit B
LSAVILSVGEDLVEEVARRVEAEGSEYPDCMVVFPGKRPAHFLRRRLALRKKESFAPPVILSMDELVDRVFDERDARAGRVRPKLEPIDAVAVLHDIQVAAAHPVGGSSFMSLDSFFSIGLKMHRDLEELCIEKVPPRKVAETQPLVEEEVPPKARERLLTLAVFYEEFYRVVQARGFSTRSTRYRAVSEEADPGDIVGDRLLIFAGFSALTRAERALFLRLQRLPRVQFIWQDGRGLRKRMECLQGSAEPAFLPRSPPSTTRFCSSPDTHGQVFALNAELERPDGDTLIVLPSPDSLFPLLRHCLSRLDPDSYNISLPYPLQRTPLYAFLDSLMELVASMDQERVYVPRYISFVLHPYVKNLRLGGSAEATRVLFHALEEELATARTRRFATLEEIEADAGLFDKAARRITEEGRPEMAVTLRRHLQDIHRRTVGRFRSFRDVREFAERCIELISWVHDESTARDHPYFTPFSEAFVRSLETISRSLMAGKSFNDTTSYFTLLRAYLAACHLSFPGTPLHGMQVLGALETRNLRFKRVFVLDANEGVLPESGPQSTLLPLPVRTALGLSTYRDQEEIAASHFENLVAGAEELSLFFVESGDKERSRFVESLLWERQKAEGGLESRHVRSIQYDVNLSHAPPAEVMKTAEVTDWLRQREYSATALDAYLTCPLKFYYKVVLNLGQREGASGEIEAVDIGSFVHEVLLRWFSDKTGRPLTPSDADPAGMARLVDAMFEQRFGPADSGANRLLRNQVRRHLCDFVQQYIGALTAGHKVTVQALEHSISARARGFALRGRLDAIEDRDGRAYLIDYKTSSNRPRYSMKLKKLNLADRSTWGAAIPTLQLPFYVLLRSQETGFAPTEIQAMFLLLGRTAMDEKIELPLFGDPAEAASVWQSLETVMFGLLGEIVSPEVPFTPTPDLKSACPWCDFKNICGTAWL